MSCDGERGRLNNGCVVVDYPSLATPLSVYHRYGIPYPTTLYLSLWLSPIFSPCPYILSPPVSRYAAVTVSLSIYPSLSLHTHTNCPIHDIHPVSQSPPSSPPRDTYPTTSFTCIHTNIFVHPLHSLKCVFRVADGMTTQFRVRMEWY